MSLKTLWTIAGVALIVWISIVMIGGIVGIWAILRINKHDEELQQKLVRFREEFEATQQEIEGGVRASGKRFRL